MEDLLGGMTPRKNVKRAHTGRALFEMLSAEAAAVELVRFSWLLIPLPLPFPKGPSTQP